jgi:hypothetical protein
MRLRLKTTLEVPRKGWLFLRIPDDALGGLRRRVWVRGTLDGRPFAGTANPAENGTHAITINRQMRAALGIQGPVEVTLDADVLLEPVLDVELPDDLVDAIAADPVAQSTFDALRPAHQKEFVLYLDEVKRPASRAERVAKSVRVLSLGRHLWESASARFAEDLKDV